MSVLIKRNVQLELTLGNQARASVEPETGAKKAIQDVLLAEGLLAVKAPSLPLPWARHPSPARCYEIILLAIAVMGSLIREGGRSGNG